MPTVVNPTSTPAQLAAASGTAPELVLQLGSVIDARVLAVRENIARIAMAGLVMEVLTEVALQAGDELKLAVGQTAEGGVRLAVVPPEARAAQGQASAPLPGATAAPPVSQPASTAGVQSASVATTLAVSRPPTANSLQPSPESVAIAQAVGAAAPRQASLSPLFANLPVIVASGGVPGDVQTAATQLLATRPPLDATLTAGDLRQAFEKSGLFLEATLARGTSPSGSPDLKAALIVFRQVLSNWLGQAALPQSAVSSQLPSSAPSQLSQQAGVQPAGLAAPAAASTLARIAASVVTQAPAALDASDGGSPVAPQARLDAATVELLRAAVQVARHEAAPVLPGQAEAADQRAPQVPTLAPGQGLTARTATEPAPPLRGAPPSPQPIASPSIVPDATPERVAHQLLEQTDAALARQTLLQVASLPERPEFGNASQAAQPRWSFEIPFMTPQGTAVAQFEIARDGGNEIEAAGPSRVWRARFSLDVEPTGPVHALITLVGGKTAVRMWAERPETAAQLRAGADGLSEALRQAALEPGDILVGEGAPPRPRQKPGRFLDRAT